MPKQRITAIARLADESETGSDVRTLTGQIVTAGSTAIAVARCRDAWQKAHDAYIRSHGRASGMTSFYARQEGAEAYCRALPILSSLQSIRDFIACVANGVLLDAIPAKRSGQLLYAAQVARSVLPRDVPPTPPSEAVNL